MSSDLLRARALMPVRGKAALPVRKSNTVIGLDVFPRRFDVWNYAISLLSAVF